MSMTGKEKTEAAAKLVELMDRFPDAPEVLELQKKVGHIYLKKTTPRKPFSASLKARGAISEIVHTGCVDLVRIRYAIASRINNGAVQVLELYIGESEGRDIELQRPLDITIGISEDPL